MTGVAASAIAIVLGIAIFIILAYKGLSPILASLVAAVIIGCTCEGGPLNAVFNTFMPQAVNFMSSVLLLIVIGGAGDHRHHRLPGQRYYPAAGGEVYPHRGLRDDWPAVFPGRRLLSIHRGSPGPGPAEKSQHLP